MPFQKGRSGNPKGRPRKGDSLAEAIRARFNATKKHQAIDAMITKAIGGDVQAFSTLGKHGWPDEARGELTLVTDPQRPPVILHRHVN